MNLHAPRPDKYKTYRARKKAAGLKEVRLWTFDPDAPGFRDRLNRDIARINDCEDEKVVMAEMEAWTAEMWRTIPE